MREHNRVVSAIESSWSRETCDHPDAWEPANPAFGHCDVSSFVAWEHLGGDLVLGEVHLGSDFQEFHYWNRVDGVDLDLTASQFVRGEVITERAVFDADHVAGHRASIRPEVKARIDAFRRRVDLRLQHT